MKIWRILLSSFIFFIFSFLISIYAANSKTGDQAELELILKKSAEYCEKLNNSVLDFICKEKITEEIHKGDPSLREVERNIYIYDYQLIRKANKIVEQRILLRENGQRMNTVDAQLKTKRFQHKNVAFGPIGLLGQKQQKNYDYKILKEVSYNSLSAS